MNTPTSFRKACGLITAFWLVLVSTSAQAALEWPQEIAAPEGTIVVYQPQPESLAGNVLSGRAAISLEFKNREDPVFGAMWFTAKIDTDRDADVAFVRDLKVERVAWPDSKDAEEQRFTAIVEGAMPEAGFEISMERLSASLATAEVVQKSLEDLNTDPPKIVFREELAVLLLFDGKPRLSEIEGSPYERALNVPMAVACKKGGKPCWLSSGTFWYEAKDPLGPWAPTSSPPADLVKMMPEPDAAEDSPSSPPAIVVATEPTELIASDGKPDWTSLAGGELLYVQNTESPWLRELATGNMYLLLSGRWYRSKAAEGPWVFVKPDELPASFAAIPPASDIGGLRTSVAGTPEADEAVRDAAIPQTAAIKRSEASLTVEYDGKPKFEKIKGTEVSYAVNTPNQVLEIGGRYYAVDNGVWFTSAAATGPWVVADEVPEDKIAEIPPSAPVYNTTHVHVYESTPDIVYVGYTPGYLWSYPYYGVPVYGTGWYYPPYYGRWYYPRPPTWGFNVGYNPWTGWSFGLSWSNGFFSMGVSWGGGYGGGYYPGRCCGGYYGGGYRGPVVINTGDINIGNNVNIGNRTEINNRISNNTQISNRMQESRQNVYSRPENRTRNADKAAVSRDLKQARPAAGRANDLYADRSGQVARRDGDQWQTRESGQWKPAPDAKPTVPEQRPATKPAARPSAPATKPTTRPTTPSTRPATPTTRPASRPSIDTRDLNRSHSARQMGASREMARPTPRGGGQRRR
jgi:hypothetical protein